MISLDVLKRRVANHIPADAPPAEEHVSSYYFRCDCQRTEKHLRFEAGDSWHTQTHRRKRVPVLDEEGNECGVTLVPFGGDLPREHYREPLAKPIPAPGKMIGHPKPWLGEHADDEDESGDEGDYCWECAVKLWEQAFRMKWERGYDPRDICNTIHQASESRGGCCVCGVLFDGDPEDIDDEVGHFENYLPDCVGDWQQLDRLLDVFGEREDEKSDDGQDTLRRVQDLIRAAEKNERLKAKPLKALAHRWTWEPKASPFWMGRAAELGGDVSSLPATWQAEHDRLEAIRKRYEGRSWESLTPEEQAEQKTTEHSWLWSQAAADLNEALGIPRPPFKRHYQSQLPKLKDPLDHIEALAMGYYRGSFRELPTRKAKVGPRRGGGPGW